MKTWMRFFWIVLLVTGCNLPETQPTRPAATPPASVTLTKVLPTAVMTTPAPPTAAGADPALTALRNGTYILRSSSEAVTITLADGEFRQFNAARNSNIFGRMIDLAAFGDLDGDGVSDAAVIIAANYGGSGTFHELIVLLSKGGKLVQTASLQLGDRIVEQVFSIRKGTVFLDYMRTGPKDPMCCPSQHAQTTYQLKGGELVMINDQVLP